MRAKLISNIDAISNLIFNASNYIHSNTEDSFK
jgi:hypothetical protein